jgi:hypothetical protein
MFAMSLSLVIGVSDLNIKFYTTIFFKQKNPIKFLAIKK